jgi:hypothetical protein
MPEKKARPRAREVILDTGRCRVERHPIHGVVIIGELSGAEVDGRAAFVPAK